VVALGASAADGFVEQAGLADPGLTAHHERGRCAGRGLVEGDGDQRRLGVAAHELRLGARWWPVAHDHLPSDRVTLGVEES
jgi:hypothetical protein